MAITHVIAHHTLRTTGDGEARFVARDTELPLDGKVEELLRELKRTYCNRTGKSYGQFSEDTGNYPFSGLLKNYCDKSISFASFTRTIMQHFKVELEKDDAVVDAHFLIFQEKLADTEYLYLFMVDHDEALYIDGELLVKSTHNIGGLMLGARIDLLEWQSGGGGYLSLMRQRGDKALTDAFFGLVGFADQQMDIYKDTAEFLDIVSAYSKQLPEDKAQEARAKVVDYCIAQDKSGESVVFDTLSGVVNEEQPEAFAKFVKQKQQLPKKALIPHRTRMRQFLRLSGRDEEMSLSFNVECLGNSIEYDADNETLTVKKIPNALKSRLLEHFREKS